MSIQSPVRPLSLLCLGCVPFCCVREHRPLAPPTAPPPPPTRGPTSCSRSPTTGPGRTPASTATRSSRRRRSTAWRREGVLFTSAFCVVAVLHAVAGGDPDRPGDPPAGGGRQPWSIAAGEVRHLPRPARSGRLRRRPHGQGLGAGHARRQRPDAQPGRAGLQGLRRVPQERAGGQAVLLLVRQPRPAPALRAGHRRRRRA